jgi:hypothetical protein
MATITLSVTVGANTVTVSMSPSDAGVTRALADLINVIPGAANNHDVVAYALAQILNRGKALALAYERQQAAIAPLT